MPGVEWRNDHTSSSSAAEWSLDNVVIPEIAKANPNWSPDEVRVAGIRIWNSRRTQDKKFSDAEENHADGRVEWEIAEVDNRPQLVTRYGETVTTLEQLWENTERYAASIGKSELVNQEEKKAQLEMQRKFIAGESEGFVSTLSHPDSVEFVQTWEKTGEKKFISKQIDIVKVIGRHLSHTEGVKLIQHIADFLKQSSAAVFENAMARYPHLIIQIGKIQEDAIRIITRGFEGISKNINKIYMSVLHIEDRIVAYVKQKIDKTIHSISGIIERVKKPNVVHNEKSRVLLINKERPRSKERIKRYVRERNVRQILEKVKMKYISLVYKENKIREGKGTQEAILIRKKLIEKVRTYYRTVQNILADKREWVRKIFIKSNAKRKNREILVKKKVMFKKQRIEFLRKKAVPIKEKITERVKHVQEHVVRIIKKTKHTVLYFIEKYKHKSVAITKEKKKRLRKQEPMRELKVAIHVWTLLSKPKNVLTGEYKTSKKKQEKLIPAEATSWILLAIIWYLAMKREQGHAKQQPKAKKVQKKRSLQPFAPQGVIFAYAT